MFYPFNQINNRVYHFITDESVLYHVSFSLEKVDMDLNEEISSTIFNIILAPIDLKKGGKKDDKIGKTIFNIICDFESQNPNCCFTYTADFFDGRQHIRNRLFNIWINSYGNETHNAINLDIHHVNIGETYYSTLLYNINYTYEAQVSKAFEEKIKYYQAVKAG